MLYLQQNYRPGSEKLRGWQITFRAVFLDYLKRGEGNLLINRDGIIIFSPDALNNFFL